MNIEYLKYFAELAKVQHYGKAAKALNISQPGLSHAIKSLEEEYGVPLFQKEGRNISLSSYGKELMNEVEELLDAYLRLEERAAGLRTEEKTVRIGSVYPLAPGTIPRMLREFGATFPFIIYNRLTPEIAEAMRELRTLMFRSVYNNPVAKKEERKARTMLQEMYLYYSKHPEQMSREYQKLIAEGENRERVVCDYISGMTDQYAMAKFKEIFIPSAWAVY